MSDRGKLKLEYIVDGGSRKSSFKTRVKGLNKKLSELTTLCGGEACSVVHSPYHETPQIWPNEVEAGQILTRFKNMLQQGRGRSKKMMNHDEFMEKRIDKVKLELQKQQQKKHHLEMTKFMYEALQHEPVGKLNVTSPEEAWSFASFMDFKMKEIQEQIQDRENPKN